MQGRLVGLWPGRWQCHSWRRVLERQQVWGEDGELSVGWVVFSVPMGHSRGLCRVGHWRHGSGASALVWLEDRGQHRDINGTRGVSVIEGTC